MTEMITTTQMNTTVNDAFNKLAVIFCAKNCEATIGKAIAFANQNHLNSKITTTTIVVDGFSTDNTIKVAKENGATSVIQQPERKFPGKGLAMRAGLKEAMRIKADIALFLDADIKNLTGEWVDKLAEPILRGGCDMARGYYERRPRDAAVTKLVAKPMISIFFSELTHFEQPLSGEVCATMKAWDSILEKANKNNQPIPDGWGIDVWFLIEAAIAGQKIQEIFLGKKEHASFDQYAEDVAILSKMSEQVLFTILKEAIKYDRFESYKMIGV
jgi:glucosyl-3-phosphoglycerate synthase